jgi:hypothetical protein
MVEFAELIATPDVNREADVNRQVLEGILIEQNGQYYARINKNKMLWGPLYGIDPSSASALVGKQVAVGLSQDQKAWLISPSAGGGTPGPGPGDDKNYVHTQGIPSATWSITHNLDKYPAVDVVDTGDSVVIPSIHYDNLNAVTLTFGSPTSGKAFVN